MRKKLITIEDAHRMLDEQYQQAVKNPWVERPLAWALYQVWWDVDADKEEVARMMRGMYPEPEQQPIPPMPK